MSGDFAFPMNDKKPGAPVTSLAFP